MKTDEKNKSFCLIIMVTAVLIFSAYPGDFDLGSAVAIRSELDGSMSAVPVDMDHDGDLDLVVNRTYSEPRKLLWFENVGALDSTMIEHEILSDPPFLGTIIITDMNCDGEPDITTYDFAGDEIFWYRNNANGASWTKVSIATIQGPSSIDVDDIDGDGDQDVLANGMYNEGVRWYENANGFGSSWNPHDVFFLAISDYKLKIADVNRDGRKDFVGCWKNVQWFDRGESSYTGHLIANFSSDINNIDCVDINGDGTLDVACLSEEGQIIKWWKNEGTDESWAMGAEIIGTFQGRMQWGDFDHDGDSDLFAFNSSRYFNFYQNLNRAGTSWNSKKFYITPLGNSFDLNDFDRDGDPDIILPVVSPGYDGLSWYPNRTPHRSIVFPNHNDLFSDIDNPSSMASYDIDRDGWQDLVVAASDAFAIFWLKNPGASSDPWTKNTIASDMTALSSVFVADLNRDAFPDVLCSASGGNTVYWYENNLPGAWTERVIDTAAYSTSAVIAADVDNDGDLDAVYSRATENGGDAFNIYLALNDGDPDVVEGTDWQTNNLTANAQTGPVSLFPTDFDHDGDMDVLSTFRDAGKIWLLRNDGGTPPGFFKLFIDETFEGVKDACISDIDRDGNPDVVAVGSHSTIMDDYTRICWYKNNPDQPLVWIKDDIDTTTLGMGRLLAKDFDLDGDMDIAATFRGTFKTSSSGVNLYRNDGQSQPSFNKSTIVSTAVIGSFPPLFGCLASSDFDKDGDWDVATGSSNDKVSIHTNGGGQYYMGFFNNAPAEMAPSATEDILRCVVRHNGIPGDAPIEMASASLLFEETAGDPLTTEELSNIVDTLYLYKDDGDGVFEPDDDSKLAFLKTFNLNAGVQVLPFSDGDERWQADPNEVHTYFVAVKTTSDAAWQTPNRFRISPVMNDEAPEVQNANTDLVLKRETGGGTHSSIVEIKDVITPQLVVDYILGKVNLDPGIESQLDTNTDGKKDAADVISFLLQ